MPTLTLPAVLWQRVLSTGEKHNHSQLSASLSQ